MPDFALDKKSIHFLERLRTHYQSLPSKHEELEIIEHLLGKVYGETKERQDPDQG